MGDSTHVLYNNRPNRNASAEAFHGRRSGFLLPRSQTVVPLPRRSVWNTVVTITEAGASSQISRHRRVQILADTPHILLYILPHPHFCFNKPPIKYLSIFLQVYFLP